MLVNNYLSEKQLANQCQLPFVNAGSGRETLKKHSFRPY